MNVDYKRLEEAKRLGYIPYAGSYKSVTEFWMINNALADIIKNHRDKPCLVRMAQKIDIWILPNYYGIKDRPYLTRNQMVSQETKDCGKEKLVDIETQENKTAAIAVKGQG